MPDILSILDDILLRQPVPESAPLSHSHLPVQHLLKQVELYRSRRRERTRPPLWLKNFIDHSAELFEPLSPVARVGFDCQFLEDHWSVGLFLGRTEIVGGALDGSEREQGFHFEVDLLLRQFDRVDRVWWSVGEASGSDGKSSSLFTIDGELGRNRLRVAIHAAAPENFRPGLREYPNGRLEAV